MEKWGKKLMGEFNKEAVASLDYEGVTREVAFSFPGYIAFYVEGKARSADMTKEVNKKHKKVKDSIIMSPRIKGKILYDLQTTKRR